VVNTPYRSGASTSGGWSPPTVQSSGGQAHPYPATPVNSLRLAQLVLLELAAAAIVAGIAGKHAWVAAGIAVGAPCALLAIVRVQRRWLYQALASRLRLSGRRGDQRRYPGLASLGGPYEVMDVAASGGSPVAVVRTGTTWTLPLELRQDSLFNDDAPVPLAGLASLLTIEDVALASVRLLNLAAPPAILAGAPPGPAPMLAKASARYCVLTLDSLRAAPALAARGGSDAAAAQILRRCALRAEEVLGSSRLRVGPLDGGGVHRLLDTCLGPSTPAASHGPTATVETPSGIRLGGTFSSTVAVGGPAGSAMHRLADLLPYLPGRVAATVLVVTPGHRGGAARGTLLVRVSAPDDRNEQALPDELRRRVGQAGLPVQGLNGDQGVLLRASTPLGFGEGMT
jgi:type VII secretion protein EccE